MGRSVTKQKKMATKKLKRGQKYCDNPECGEPIPSRAMTCKICDQEQTQKSESAGSKRGGFEIVRTVAAYVKEHGGIDAAKAQLDALEALLRATGGISQAKAALAELEKIKDSM
jgi:hypothetical protein